jgi:hypothetical protein
MVGALVDANATSQKETFIARLGIKSVRKSPKSAVPTIGDAWNQGAVREATKGGVEEALFDVIIKIRKSQALLASECRQ